MKNTKPFWSQLKRRLQELVKMENELQKPYLTDYNLLIAQNLWQVYSQILLTILQMEFIKLNLNSNMMTKNVGLVELYTKIVTVFLNTKPSKMI